MKQLTLEFIKQHYLWKIPRLNEMSQELFKPEQFNLAISNFLALYSQFLGQSQQEMLKNISEFNSQLDNQIKQINEKSVQLGQDDQTES